MRKDNGQPPLLYPCRTITSMKLYFHFGRVFPFFLKGSIKYTLLCYLEYCLFTSLVFVIDVIKFLDANRSWFSSLHCFYENYLDLLKIVWENFYLQVNFSECNGCRLFYHFLAKRCNRIGSHFVFQPFSFVC
jgi:hypothetical protein